MSATVHRLPFASRLPTPQERGRRASDAVRAAGGTALDAALEAIHVTFDETAIVWSRKQQVRSMVRRGSGDVENRVRWSTLAQWAVDRSYDYSALLILFARWEREAKMPARRGVYWPQERPGRNVCASDMATLRLALRFMRRYAPDACAQILDDLTMPAGYPVEHPVAWSA